MKNDKNTASLGFEQKIWEAADTLRGNLNAAEYEGVVLGLIFLKYISDKFEAKYQELLEDEYADAEDKDEYTAENVFFVPPTARWKVISEAAHTPEIGQVIDDAMREIEDNNPRLKGILPKNYARKELDKRRLGDVVDLFTNVEMMSAGEEKDLLGRAYEYCLMMFASMEGKNAGEFYTPSCIVRTIVEILKPYRGRIYDPACGSGGMFVQSAKFIQNHQKDLHNISIYGQEANPNTWKMCHMNLAIRGLEGNLGTYADTFFDDQHPTLKADFIMANPPFNLDKWGQDRLLDDVRWKFGVPPSGNANFAWVQHMIHHLSPTGKIGLVLANGSLSSQTGGEGDIRRAIIEADLVEGIIALPSQLFYSTGIPVCLWFLSRGKAQPGKTLFIDARGMGTMVTRRLRELSAEGDIRRLADTFQAFQQGTLEDEKGFCAVVDTAKIAEQDYILTPGRYVGIAEAEDDGEPFQEKVQRITGVLSKLFARSHELEEEIRKHMLSFDVDFRIEMPESFGLKKDK